MKGNKSQNREIKSRGKFPMETKQETVHRRNPAYFNNPVIGSDVNSNLLTEKLTIDYAGNKIYKNGAQEKILTGKRSL
jgi:hypothetical protein